MVAVFLLIIAAVLVGRLQIFSRWYSDPAVKVRPADAPPGPAPNGKLFVYVRGMSGDHAEHVEDALRGRGEFVSVRYEASWKSSVKPDDVARETAKAIESRFDAARHDDVVLIGESLGALVTRRAFLAAEEAGLKWADRVSRVVLLAGMNRGWDFSGNRPLDMRWSRWLEMWVLSWAARLLHIGQLALATEAGSPFVANLRLDWMNRLRKPGARPLEVVQLLGDIDDFVSDEDSKDLRSMASENFAWVRVRGTRHGNISDFRDPTTYAGLQLGEYRRQKFVLAATAKFADVKGQNEEQAFRTDEEVTHVVFVVHGIRDLGEWAAAFETELLRRFKPTTGNRIAVASIRYGYFGMGPFLLGPGRGKYVKWFMDEYTETLARYPKAQHIHFVGHSNGTYLLAEALRMYDSLKVERVVFGGSVVPKAYKWNETPAQRRVEYIRNYVAADDKVVALFPRFFELPGIRRALDNNIGSAGFNGFNASDARVENVKYIRGEHSAFLARAGEIADFVLAPGRPPAAMPDAGAHPGALQVVSDWFTPFVWVALAAVILTAGWFFVMSANEPRWPFLALYVLVVFLILKAA